MYFIIEISALGNHAISRILTNYNSSTITILYTRVAIV